MRIYNIIIGIMKWYILILNQNKNI